MYLWYLIGGLRTYIIHIKASVKEFDTHFIVSKSHIVQILA